MTKTEYLTLKESIISRLGKPEYDMGDAVNDSAREIKKLYREYRSQQQTVQHQQQRKQLLDEKEQKAVVNEYKAKPAAPIELTEADLELFTEFERPIVEAYFMDVNQTAETLSKRHKQLSRQKIVALMRSGPFQRCYDKVYGHLMPMKVRNALLKAIDDGNARLIERLAEQTGALKNQEMTLNVNKTLDDPKLLKKLKDLGDSEA